MTMHNYHEGLAGFHPDQVLHDGCGECEQRSNEPLLALAHLDVGAFERAWQRAAAWQQGSTPSVANTLSHAELPVLRILWGIQVQLERRGVPIGHVPGMEVLAGW